jgi:hypothetical protein
MAVPDYAMPAPQPGELASLLRKTRRLALRYPSTHEGGIPSGLYVCRDKSYSIENLSTRFRSSVRKGLDRCEIRPVERAELLTEGLQCNRDTMQRQGRFTAEFGEPRKWGRFVDAAYQMPAIEVTGAFVDGRLGAYVVGCLDDGCYNLLYSYSLTHLRQYYLNHALYFRVMEFNLHRPSVHAVWCGPKTLLSENGLHDFKTRMGFNLEPHNVVVRLHPAIEPLAVQPAVGGMLRLLHKRWPENLRVARIEACLRSAREARRFTVPRGTVRHELGAEHE